MPLRRAYLCSVRLLLLFCVLSPLWASAQQSELETHRKTVISQFLATPNSPIDSESVHGLSYFPGSDSFRFPTIILPLLDTTELAFPTSSGAVKVYRPYAKIIFQYEGSMHQLIAYESPLASRNPFTKDRLFMPFWDDTNGFESYGGGRYLEISRKAVDARSLTLDFNKAYNPWCAYSDEYSCPIPPPENRLAFSVLAGEAAFTVGAKDGRPTDGLAPAEPSTIELLRAATVHE